MKIVQSANILNWYPFKENQKVLNIGEQLEELTRLLANKCSKVQNVNRISEIDKINERFDIITLIGINEYERIDLKYVIKKLENSLEVNGKILIAVDNKFGLKFWAGNPEKILDKKFISLIGYNNEPEKIETYTKKYIEKVLQTMGYNTRFYYPLPDYKVPNVIFTDEQLPKYNRIDKYNPYYSEKSDILFNEIDVFREILKTNKEMFAFFTNSFLVEITKGECDKTYKYISFNNMRKPEYQLITKIADTYVEKQIVNENAQKHYEDIKNNIIYLQENGVNLVDYIEGKNIKSKYIEQKYLLNNVLTEKLEKNKIDEFEEIIEKYINEISINTFKIENYEDTVFGKYNIETENKDIINNLHFMKNGLWDMTFKNCFLIENELYFFDQEWNAENLPVEYILYRAIFYTISLRRFISIEKLFDKYNLTAYIELFKKLDDKIQAEIRDDEVWKFYSQNYNFNIDETKQELENIQLRSTEQQTEINNLNERFEAQQLENNNLKEENKQLREKVNNINKEKAKLQTEINSTFFNKVKRKIKRIIK